MWKRHTKKMMVMAALFMSVAGVAVLQAGEARDPFTTPEKRLNVYNYARSMGLLSVKGIVRTERFNGCLAQISTMDTLTVLKTGDKISLDNNGLPHMFKVHEIRDKSVVFINMTGKTYEVFIR